MKTQILKMLRESEEYISGQVICERLGVSRTAVWKYINQLKEEGYQIEAVSNKGYHIAKYPDLVTPDEIASVVNTKLIANEVIFFDETDSTNNQAKRRAEDGAVHGTLVIAETQNSGKGRRGKQWSSPKGTGIWMSLILRPDINPSCATMLTLIAAMAVSDALCEHSKLDYKIKWPNDIVVNGKKVCGILTEMSAELNYVNYVVIGIGINANVAEFEDAVKDIATSILIETGDYVKRSDIINSFAKSFEMYYEKFLLNQDLIYLKEEYNKRLINVNREVKVSDANESFTGKALGIDEKGNLLVEKQDGLVALVMAGEVSVRGLYGYV